MRPGLHDEDDAHPPATRFTRRRGLGWLLLAPLAACARVTPVQPGQVLPVGAHPLRARGPWDIALANASASLNDALRPSFGPLELQPWALPAGVSWAEVQAQVQQRLGDAWAPMPEVPAQGHGAQMRAWRSGGGLLQASNLFGLAWLDAPVALPEGPVRLLLTAVSRTS